MKRILRWSVCVLSLLLAGCCTHKPPLECVGCQQQQPPCPAFVLLDFTWDIENTTDHSVSFNQDTRTGFAGAEAIIPAGSTYRYHTFNHTFPARSTLYFNAELVNMCTASTARIYLGAQFYNLCAKNHFTHVDTYVTQGKGWPRWLVRGSTQCATQFLQGAIKLQCHTRLCDINCVPLTGITRRHTGAYTEVVEQGPF